MVGRREGTYELRRLENVLTTLCDRGRDASIYRWSDGIGEMKLVMAGQLGQSDRVSRMVCWGLELKIGFQELVAKVVTGKGREKEGLGGGAREVEIPSSSLLPAYSYVCPSVPLLHHPARPLDSTSHFLAH